jgi:MFS transporter, FHS family, glucose/mannose:H+ symporter
MQSALSNSSHQTQAVLHPVFALTGVLHAIGGPLLPSLVSTFHLNDSQSGLLFFLYFAGSSLGALLCRGNYARIMALGFAAAVGCCLLVASIPWPLLLAVFLFLGISVGIPMTAVSLFVGRAFPERCAPLLTFLNFTWSAGALAAPLLAAQVLVHHTYRSAYLLLAIAAAIAALVCALALRDAPEPAPKPSVSRGFANLRLIIVFALATFLQVGVENTSAAWLSTYSLRMTGEGVVLAAASTSLYWGGFLASRGVASLLLLRTQPKHLFRVTIAIALAAGILLAAAPSVAARSVAMFSLGVALAPIYPLIVAAFFARARHTSDSRWVMASAGFGGSVLPWLAGWISTHTGTLRAGILVIPAALLLMIAVLPTLSESTPAIEAGSN